MANFYIPIYQIPAWMLVALGFYVAFRILNFPDLTIDASFIAGAVGSAFGASHFDSSIVGVCCGAFLGGTAGFFTAFIYLTNPRPVYKLLAGVLVIFIFYSVVYRILGAKLIASFNNKETIINQLIQWEAINTSINYRPIFFLIECAIVLLICIFLNWFYSTNLGLKMRAVATRPSIIANKPFELAKIVIPGLVISNVIVGIGGWLHASCNAMAQVVIFGYLIHGLASSLLGELVIDSIPQIKGYRSSLKILLFIPIFGTVLYWLIRSLITSFLINKISVDYRGGFSLSMRDTDTIVAAFIILILLIINIIKFRINTGIVSDESQM